MTTEEIRSIFVRRYMIAISLIVMLVTSAFLILYFALKQSETTAMIVNMSGKQRMLSQRIASLSQHYYRNTFVYPDPAVSATTKESLVDTIEQMRQANESLASGKLDHDIQVSLSPEISELYFGPMHLKRKVDDYLVKAEYLLTMTQGTQDEKAVEELVRDSHGLLHDLNEAVIQYQKEGDEKIGWISRLDWIAWIVTLGVLMLEVIIIFQPMADKIRQLFQEILWNKENLEQQVALRTLHLEQANLKLEKMASHDPLTGIKNRLYMERDLENVQNHYRQHGLPYAVAMFDIDWFKAINDNYGHDVGDFVLKELAQLFRNQMRAQDSIYRSGGEEFVILLNRISLEQTYEKLEELRTMIDQHEFLYGDLNLHCTISGGFYHSQMNGDVSVKGILKIVDSALYDAKAAGRNTIKQAVVHTRG